MDEEEGHAYSLILLYSACLQLDPKGGNVFSVTSGTFSSSGSLGSIFKQKSSLSAKACIAEILPSRFKHQMAQQSITMHQSNTTRPAHKAQSCENLLRPSSMFENKTHARFLRGSMENMLAKSSRDYKAMAGSTTSLQEYSSNAAQSTFRPSTAEFSTMYRDMHNINRSSLHSASSCSSVRDIASQFEKDVKDRASGIIGQSGSEHVPRNTVSSRVSTFEQLIQRSRSMPSLDLSSGQSVSPTPSRSRVGLTSACSAESLLETSLKPNGEIIPQTVMLSTSSSNIEEVSSDLSDPVHVDTLSGCTDEIDHLSNASMDSCNSASKQSQKYKVNTCKSSCPASYTRFTTIRRHEQKVDKSLSSKSDAQFDWQMFQRNIYLISPLPFKLKKPTQNTSKKSPYATEKTTNFRDVQTSGPHAEKPLLPARQSSLDIVERLSSLSVNNLEKDSSSVESHFSDTLNNGDHVSFPLCYNLDSNNNSHLSEHRAGGGVFVHLHLCGRSSTCLPALSHYLLNLHSYL
ncbi:sorbin and SH3 domain-containing protein 1-like [Discoglossus pictus]